MDELDIILLTHNNIKNTARCMDALYKNTCIGFRVTVIDDSIDETPAYFARLAKENDNINYVRPDVPIRIANQAINIGVSLTKSDPVGFLTCSTFVEPDWLGVKPLFDHAPLAIELFDTNPKIGLMGFKILDPDTNTIIEAGDYVTPNAIALNISRGEPSHHCVRISEVNAIGFCAILIRRAAIPKGGWDETTYIGFRSAEDIDNCLTVREAGWKILYNGLGSVYHSPGGSVNSADIKANEERAENIRRFENKWKGRVPLP